MIRTKEHPSVEIKTTDLSLVAPNMQMTTSLVCGFANNGEDLSPQFISNMSSFQTMFGKPQTDAERYAYYAAREILNENGNIYFAKLPYDNEARDKFRAIGFTTAANATVEANAVYQLYGGADSGLAPSACTVQQIKVDNLSNLVTADELDALRTQNNFTELGVYSNHSFVIVDKSRAALDGEFENEGNVIVVLPAYNAIAYQNQGSTWFDSPSAPYTGWAIMDGMITPPAVEGQREWLDNDWVMKPNTRYSSDSISKLISREFPTFQYPFGKLDQTTTNQLVVLVLKTYVDVNNGSLLNYQLVEKFVGSLDRNSVDKSTGKSNFLGNIINSNSEILEFYFNFAHDKEVIKSSSFNTTSGKVYSMVQGSDVSEIPATPILWATTSFAKAETRKSIKFSDILEGLDLIFTKLSNIDEIRLDTVVDAGLTSIAQYIYNHIPADTEDPNYYSPEIWDSDDDISSRFDCEQWLTVASALINFCSSTRKDCMAIIDAPRALALQGNEKVIRSTKPQNTIDVNILSKLNYLTGINSSYGECYVTWHKIADIFTGNMFWTPGSIKRIGIYCHTDANYNFWEAPYGLERGIINGVVDISFSPHDKQEDQIYLRSFNYTKEYPLDGYVAWGNKTLQAAPSAFDRINVRRLFLRMERHAYDVSRYFIGVINNFYNRSRLVSIVEPKFASVKRLGGMYEYKLICDESNNTEEVIDNNELKLAVLIKPSRVADFIRVHFYALRTGAAFEEVIL